MPKFQRKRWPRIFFYALTTVIIGIGFICSVGSVFAKNLVYRSSAVLEMRPSSPKRFAASEGLLPDQNAWDIQKAILSVKSRSTVESIMEELNLYENINNNKERRRLTDKIMAGIDIKERSPDIIDFDVTYDDPIVCQKIVKLLMRKIIRDELGSSDEKTEANIEWLDNELEYFRKKLLRGEENLNKFREDNPEIILDIELGYSPDSAMRTSALGTVAKRQEKYSQELQDLGIEYKAMKAEEKLLAAEEAEVDKMIVKEKITSSQTGEVISTKESVNPVCRELQLDSIRIRQKIVGIRARIDVIKPLAETAKKKLKNIFEKEMEYARLRREYNNNVVIFSKLQKMREKVRFMRRLEMRERGVHFMILEGAEIPIEPYQP